jgi:hypothetical protein
MFSTSVKDAFLLTVWHVIMSKVSAFFHHRFIDVLHLLVLLLSDMNLFC